MIIIPIGHYDDGTSGYNALSPSGTYGWATGYSSSRCICSSEYAELFWLENTTSNVNEVNRLFNRSYTYPPFIGIILCNNQVPYQVFNLQNNTIYNVDNLGYIVMEYNGRTYYADLVSTGNTGMTEYLTGIYSDTKYANISAGLAASSIRPITQLYPITYRYTNSAVSGPSEAAVGDIVTVSAVPDVGYSITDASTQILVTNNDVAVPYTWDATNQRITFTMPDPT